MAQDGIDASDAGSASTLLQDPFSAARQAHAEDFFKCLNFLDDPPFIFHDKKLLLRAILLYTPNADLLCRFTTFSIAQLEDLHELCLRGLQNLGRKPDYLEDTSGWSSPTQSPASVSSVSQESLHTIARETSIGSAVIAALGINEDISILENMLAQSRQESFDTDAIERQDELCLITAAAEQFWEIAHLFPPSALSNKEAIVTWRFIASFLGDTLFQTFAEELESNLHSCANRISLICGLRREFDIAIVAWLPGNTVYLS
ncbi:hypothetical protein ABW21_db0200252 [Orbilia brochopaga]|nr:hypothetical protein ABW21_db0200252 [Drechslerella brochopaga]